MRIEKLRLKNFRCFEELEMHLHPQYNVLIGINGAGKTTILDSLAIALGGYLAGFDGIKSNSILTEDAHCKMFPAGSRIEAQEQFPVEVYVEAAAVSNTMIAWQRELYGKDRRTTYGNIKLIVEYAKMMQNQIRSGDETCILPLVAYYGAGRSYLQKRKPVQYKKGEALNRQMGYVDCMAAELNEKQMMQWFEDMTYIQLQEGRPIAELETVKKALRECYLSADPSVIDAQFTYDVKSHELEVCIKRDHETERLPVRMLSDGEKGIIGLVADIAYRMALLNPDLLSGILETPGVVLIDEIDLHLHPAWQKRIVGDLIRIFPNVQFIMTVHAPSILVNVPKENIWILDRYRLYQPQSTTYGRTVEEVMQEVMDINVRPEEILSLQRRFDQAVEKKEFEEAKKLLEQMRTILGDDAKEVIENQIALDVEM